VKSRNRPLSNNTPKQLKQYHVNISQCNKSVSSNQKEERTVYNYMYPSILHILQLPPSSFPFEWRANLYTHTHTRNIHTHTNTKVKPETRKCHHLPKRFASFLTMHQPVFSRHAANNPVATSLSTLSAQNKTTAERGSTRADTHAHKDDMYTGSRRNRSHLTSSPSPQA